MFDALRNFLMAELGVTFVREYSEKCRNTVEITDEALAFLERIQILIFCNFLIVKLEMIFIRKCLEE